MLHPRSYPQAALHHGGQLQGALVARVSSQTLSTARGSLCFYFLCYCKKTQHFSSIGNFGGETSSQMCSSSALQFSSRSLAGGLCRIQGIQGACISRLKSTMSLLLGVAESCCLTLKWFLIFFFFFLYYCQWDFFVIKNNCDNFYIFLYVYVS